MDYRGQKSKWEYLGSNLSEWESFLSLRDRNNMLTLTF